MWREGRAWGVSVVSCVGWIVAGMGGISGGMLTALWSAVGAMAVVVV